MNTSQARHLIVNSCKVLIGAEGYGYKLERGADIEVSMSPWTSFTSSRTSLGLIRKVLLAHIEHRG